MSSKYPLEIDSSLTLPTIIDGFSAVDATTVNRLRDAIVNAQAEMGIKPSGTYGTIRGRLDALETAIGGGGGGGDFDYVPGAISTVLVSNGSIWTVRQLTYDDILPAFSVTMSGSQTVQVGASVVTPAFTASYASGPATSVTLTDNDGSLPKSISSPYLSFSSNGTFTKTTNSASVTFTTTAIKGVVSKTSSVSITWLPRVYYGVHATGTFNEAFIEGLDSNALAATRARTITVTAGSGEHIYYAFPTSYGTPTFTVGGFSGGFNLVATTSVTNSNGVTQNYDLWESTNSALGNTTVVVT